MNEDDEILQDFMVEAGEILEQLSEQLVDLERSPGDTELLNAIFRGFHTVKGGAGFLQFEAVVDCCHVAENVFDTLRKGECELTSELMDAVLQALDCVNLMFDEIRGSKALTPASPGLIKSLANFALGEVKEAPAAEIEAQAEAQEVDAKEPSAALDKEPSAAEDENLISDDEFELMLDALNEEKQAEKVQAPEANAPGKETPDIQRNVDFEDFSAESSTDNFAFEDLSESSKPADEITEDEFEALLNKLSKGKSEGGGSTSAASLNKAPSAIFDKEPSAALNEKPSAALNEEPSAIFDKEPSAALNEEPSAIFDKEPSAALNEKPSAASIKTSPVQAGKPSPVPASQEAVIHKSTELKKQAGVVKKEDKKVPGPNSKGAARGAPGKAVSKENVGEATVRVDTKRLDDIMNMVGELVLVRNRLVRLGSNLNDEAMSKAVSNLDVVTADLQSSVMKTRMQPIKKVFGRFPRVVRDLARSLDKEINLELLGEETDLDKNLVEALADPLVHLVRNSVDHGIESPDDREAAGKPRVGTIILSAEQEGDHILLSIKDDGKGMDPNVIREIAINKGAIERDVAERLSDSECFNLIFAPGFSTKEVVSDVSGRGVGMDVVKTKIGQLNGTVDIESSLGEGSRIIIKVPLTLAIMPTLMVMLADQTFALPLVSVNEIFHLDLSATNTVDGQEVIVVRGKALPLYYLSRWLVGSVEKTPSKLTQSHVVIVSVGSQKIGFVVDQLIGQEEVVIKPLGKMLQGTAGMAGATITGDGTIALILDVPSMLNRYA